MTYTTEEADKAIAIVLDILNEYGCIKVTQDKAFQGFITFEALKTPV